MLEAIFLNPTVLLLAKVFLVVSVSGYIICTIIDKKLQKEQRRMARRIHRAQTRRRCA